jgi:hypothetical protein
MLIVTTGRSFFAVNRSQCGISILEENRAEIWRKRTAMISCKKRKRSGVSGVELSTVLFLFNNTSGYARQDKSRE